MVPFPIILPVPLPIPVPIPIPPDIMEKYSKSKESETHSISFQDKSDKLDNKLDHRKRKNSSEFPKQKKKNRKMSVNASTDDCASVQNIGIETIKENSPSEKYFNPVKNVLYRISEPPVADLNPPAAVRISRSDPDNESRSYSPLSEAISSNEEEYSEKAIKNNGSVDDFSNINFSNFNLSLVQSSPLLLARATERHLPNETNNNLENSNSHSPTNLSVKDKHNLMSSNAVNFKKKHLHDQLSLMT
ncbi:sine oculis-binding [Trichonephila clavipes]|nr:sine oculis-binding [Trichonephila clavipes]